MIETYQHYIDDILAAVNSPATADPSFLSDTAALYAEACAEVNDRLRRVGKLLEKGLRSEAIQMAEEDPHVLDAFEILDFPESHAWSSMLEEWGMSPPPRLLSDVAEQIDLAYAAQRPVEILLKKHRMFALGRAPLSSRIYVLRRLIESEDEATAWEDDLAELETTRLKQLEKEARSAAKAEDLPVLEKLVEELGDKAWRTKVPAALAKSVKALCRSVAERFARQELEEIGEALNQAHMAFDVEEGIVLAERWSTAIAVANLISDDPILDRTQPARDWVRSERDKTQRSQDREMAIIALEQSLDDQAPVSELTQLFYNAEVFDEPIPDVVRRRYEERISSEEVSSFRRHRLIMAGVVGAVLLVGGGVSYVLSEQLHQRRIADAAQAIRALNEAGSLVEAKTRYDSFLAESPEVAESIQVQKEFANTTELLRNEKQRLVAFSNAIEKLEAWSQGTEPNAETLEEARTLAATVEEHERTKVIEDRVKKWRRQNVRQQTESLAKALKQYRKELEEFEEATTASNAGVSGLVERIGQLQKKIDDAVRRHPHSSPALAASSAPLLRRANALVDSILLGQRRVTIVSKVTEAVGDVRSFSSALQSYYLTRPDLPAEAAAAIIAESTLWNGLQEWDALFQRYFAGRRNLTSEEARVILAAGRQLATQFVDIPLRNEFERREPYLLSIANRKTEDGERLLGGLQKRFRADPLIANLFMVRNGNDRYYCRKLPDTSGAMLKLKYVTDLQLSEHQVTLRQTKGVYVGRAPQSIFAEKALKVMDLLPQRGWEGVFVAMIEALLKDPQLDPVVKVLLLQDVLKPAMEGSSVLAKAYMQTYTEINDSGVGGAIWVDPDDPILQQERTRAEIALNGLVRLTKSDRTAIYRRARSLLSKPATGYDWMGWLHDKGNGQWEVLSKKGAEQEGKLLVILKTEDDPMSKLITIGVWGKNGSEIASTSPAVLVDGRPVFLQPTRREVSSRTEAIEPTLR